MPQALYQSLYHSGTLWLLYERCFSVPFILKGRVLKDLI
jgi:hypothetical protein